MFAFIYKILQEEVVVELHFTLFENVYLGKSLLKKHYPFKGVYNVSSMLKLNPCIIISFTVHLEYEYIEKKSKAKLEFTQILNGNTFKNFIKTIRRPCIPHRFQLLQAPLFQRPRESTSAAFAKRHR